MLGRISKKFIGTKKKVSKEHKRYSLIKKKILTSKNYSPFEKKQVILEEEDIKKQRISNIWEKYKEEKYGLTHKSPYTHFTLTRKLLGVQKEIEGQKRFFKFHEGYQLIYKANKDFDIKNLDYAIPRILNTKYVNGILVVFEIYNKDEDTTQIVSNYINKQLYEGIISRNETIFQYATERFSGYGNYVLKFIYLRVIYKK